jgi:hypothetical protein
VGSEFQGRHLCGQPVLCITRGCRLLQMAAEMYYCLKPHRSDHVVGVYRNKDKEKHILRRTVLFKIKILS